MSASCGAAASLIQSQLDDLLREAHIEPDPVVTTAPTKEKQRSAQRATAQAA